MSEKPTSKKLKTVGYETYINRTSGEIEEFQVISMEDQDFNFDKIWVGHLLSAIDEISNAKVKVLMHLLNKRNPVDNRIISTMAQISQATGVSEKTVQRTINTLCKHDVLRRHKGIKSVWDLNPDMMFRGSHSKRMKIVLDYNKNPQMNLPLEADEGEEAA